MQKLTFSISIDAPKEKVWHTMLDQESYRQWTDVFAAGSRYEGDWSEGSKILFLAPEEDAVSGMISKVETNRPYEFISIQHLGMLNKGKEDLHSDEVKSWSGAHENYTLIEKDGQTEVLVEMDTVEEFKKMFEKKWPEALQRLKEIAEGSAPKTIIVSTVVRAPKKMIWECWNQPKHIAHWAFASDDWEATPGVNDVRGGGTFSIRMAAKDGSTGFDFTGTYTKVKEYERIEYTMDDGRCVKIQFDDLPHGIHITESFEPESENPRDVQQSGWQAILNNFKKYVEAQVLAH